MNSIGLSAWRIRIIVRRQVIEIAVRHHPDHP
jgi:hypothetical protein